MSQDHRQIEPTKQAQRDHVIDDQKLIEAAFALSPGMAPRQQVAHQLTRTQLLEHLKAQGMAKLAVIFQLLYSKGHQRFLSSFDTTIALVIVYQKMNLSSYLNAIAFKWHCPLVH